ncbi:MAG: hypothetical protein WBA31_07050 [Candidatus Dormiibacterota bacterium]
MSSLPGVGSGYANALAPFQPGQRPGRRRGQLSVLHLLNNLDKHRKPLLTHHVVLRGTTQMSLAAPVTMVPIPGWSRLKPGTELVHLVWEFAQFPSPHWNPPILNHRFGRDGSVSGTLERLDIGADDQGHYPVAILRTSTGRKATLLAPIAGIFLLAGSSTGHEIQLTGAMLCLVVGVQDSWVLFVEIRR